MSLRFPKRGFRKARFNTHYELEQINLGRIAYFIQKGKLDPSEPITMKVLHDTGVITKIEHGVKILGAGADKLLRLGVSINLEASDATAKAIEAIQ